MDRTVRKNITLKESTYDFIAEQCNRYGHSFSEFLWRAALEKIKRLEDQSLLEYLQENMEYMSAAEQAEIDALDIDFSPNDGKELTVNDILSGNL